MAKCGEHVCFHGAYLRKSDAQRKEAKVKGSFIRFVLFRYGGRFVVMTRKKVKR
jgi:hypothetical protein